MMCVGLVWSLVLTSVSGNVPTWIVPAVKPFSLGDVQLGPESHFGIAQERNFEYLSGLNNSQLTCIFTSAANLTHCVGSNCDSRGDPTKTPCNPLPGEMSIGAYYGHYLGHWMSATSMLYENTRRDSIKRKSAEVVATLAACQVAWGNKYGEEGEGYLFPYDPIVFEILEHVIPPFPYPLYSVPFYTVHKLMAGLLDQYQRAGNAQALKVVINMAGWVVRNVHKTMARGGQGLWQRVLATEWGGMNEVLYNLYAVTGTKEYLEVGYLFNHWTWSAPLAVGIDDLSGNHANTHIPEVIGNARGYELTGNETDKAIVHEFFDAIMLNHSWATGGSNDGEYWGPPARLGDQLNPNTEESCTQYNILKLSRHMYQWTANSSLADFYERALMNGILGNQNRLDSTMTKFIYMLPLGGGGIHKAWGRSDEEFPCCWGTLSEQFSKLSDSIYFHSEGSLFVNQFVTSTVTWTDQNVTVTQVAGYPESTTSTTSLRFTPTSTSAVTTFTVHLRVPSWAKGKNVIQINGVNVPQEEITPGTYLKVTRSWKAQDAITVWYPMGFWASPVLDTRPAWNSTMAFMYGPLVLAGITNSAYFIPDTHNPRDPKTFITRNSTTELTFEARGRPDEDPSTPILHIKLIPLFNIMEEAYTVYFHTTGTSVVPYSPTGARVPTTHTIDFEAQGGTSFNRGPSDPMCDGSNIRSGNPGDHSRLLVNHPVLGKGHTITRVTLRYRYTAGYTPAPGHTVNASTLSVVLISDDRKTILRTLYTSPPLGKYSYDHFKGYSPSIVVDQKGLKVPNTKAVFVALLFDNHQRNLQIPVDDRKDGFDVMVYWN